MGASRTVPPLPAPLTSLFEAKLAGGDLELPFLPDAQARVLAACNEDDVDARELAELIERDQALTGHVLRVANSAAYAPEEPIVSLQQAVSRLGLRTIREICLAVTMQGRVFRVPGYQVKIREMWMHSAMTAAYAKEIARVRRKSVEAAFMSGLLHDVGRPIVMQAFLDVLGDMTEKRPPVNLLVAAMDFFHEEVGALLVDHWGLPAWVRPSIAHHHDFAAAGEHAEDAAQTRLACQLAHWAIQEDLDEAAFDRRLPTVAALSLYDDDVEELLARRGDVLEVAEAFS